MKHFLLALIAVALTACHSPGQTQATHTQAAQTQATPPQAAPARTQTPTSASGTDPASRLEWIAVSSLPPQGQQTYRLILSGGPFPYARDGVAFQNREGVLPRRSQGAYSMGAYREYTVRTPGSSDRGARRIVCAALPECYYTGDHYASFQRIGP